MTPIDPLLRAESAGLAALRCLGFDHNVAPDPVRHFAMDGNVVCAVIELPITRELIAKVGPKPWLEPWDRDVMPSPESMD